MGSDFELRHWRLPSRPKSLVIPDSLHLDPPTTPPSSNGYTSLCDLITSPRVNDAVNSPTAVEIRIRNHLVKQAAYAYLQPTPSSTENSSCRSRRRRRRFSLRRTLAAIESCFGFIGRLLSAIRIRKLSS